METDRTIEMLPEEIEAFLDRGGTGVLSLAAGDVPYATPVSYGFDPDERQFYFRLGAVAETDKGGFLEASDRARFVVYELRDDVWTSVIATGPLAPISEEELTLEVARALRQADLPLFSIWDEPREALEFDLYRLSVEELSGRRSVAGEEAPPG
ncbi:MAG: pyridoxamine 5'-phosphate oxidase family protein [Halobacteriales archaeon]|nr:pyridoxamine 5'-phosphate oxidase family protein [Halobacteriales archaeon]